MNGIPSSTHVHREGDVKGLRKKCVTCYLWGKIEENQDKSVTQLLNVCWGTDCLGCLKMWKVRVRCVQIGVKSCVFDVLLQGSQP